jgi:riboflavin kinase/FMN adenylyltransferase
MAPADDPSARPGAGSPAGRPFTICREDEAVPAALAGAIAAIGNFDGVHRGHGALVEAVREEADRRGVPAVMLTFEPHPRAYFAPDLPMFRLTGPAAKEIVFARLGLDGLIVRRFDALMAGTTAAGFVHDLLARDLGLTGVVIGHDFHFGRGREGTPEVLARLCAEASLACRIIPPVSIAEGEAPVSSSAIREALRQGDIVRANRLLGYRWFVCSEVRHGDKRGRTLGYPTANVALPDCALSHGIYAVRIGLPDGTVRDGVASYGRRPTFDDGAPLLEVNLFGFSGDLYGRTIAVEFLGYIRGEERFSDAEALIARMDVDAAEARTIIAGDRVPSMIG